ncbi:MAG: carboxypeptidase-like regulatory domain-containing protein [Chitinophagales bacterium]|nr:carboxypeptidase-like regulatory domain-containing protein [Chitinophagales bacterium]
MCVLLPSIIWGQIDVSGEIIDQESNNPLKYATIANLTQNISTISDINGEFRLSAKSGDFIQISYIGKQTHTFFASDSSKDLVILMTTQNSKLKTVEVFAHSDLQKSLLYKPRIKSATPEIEPLNLQDRLSLTNWINSPISTLITSLSPRLKRSIEYKNKLYHQDKAFQRYNLKVISQVTQETDPEILQKIRQHCDFSIAQINIWTNYLLSYICQINLDVFWRQASSTVKTTRIVSKLISILLVPSSRLSCHFPLRSPPNNRPISKTLPPGRYC